MGRSAIGHELDGTETIALQFSPTQPLWQTQRPAGALQLPWIPQPPGTAPQPNGAHVHPKAIDSGENAAPEKENVSDTVETEARGQEMLTLKDTGIVPLLRVEFR